MKKRLTAVFDGNHMPDLTALLQVALEFKIDTLDGDEPSKIARHRPGGGKTSQTTIMEHFSPQGNFRRDTAVGWLTAAGYHKNTISSALLPLIRGHYVRDLGDGRYQFAKPYP